MPRRLRILKYPWHTAHDYELSKLSHDFLYLSCTPRRWATEQRPIPPNIEWVPRHDARETDVMILHVDQWTWNEPSKRFLFLRFRDAYAGPKVVINHGCNLADGMDNEQLYELLGDDVFMVANSSTAAELWGYPRSRFIRHGMSPDEWPQTDYARHEAIVVQAHGRIHAAYRNHEGVKRIEETVPLRWVGRDIRFDSFNKYRHFLQSSSIFLQPSFASPNPRSRTEAMLTGLAVVTTNMHGEEEYIENGVNGFCSNDEEELAEYLQWLLRNPERTREIGRRGRETAHQVFHIDNFVAQWHALLDEVVA